MIWVLVWGSFHSPVVGLVIMVGVITSRVWFGFSPVGGSLLMVKKNVKWDGRWGCVNLIVGWDLGVT